MAVFLDRAAARSATAEAPRERAQVRRPESARPQDEAGAPTIGAQLGITVEERAVAQAFIAGRAQSVPPTEPPAEVMAGTLFWVLEANERGGRGLVHTAAGRFYVARVSTAERRITQLEELRVPRAARADAEAGAARAEFERFGGTGRRQEGAILTSSFHASTRAEGFTKTRGIDRLKGNVSTYPSSIRIPGRTRTGCSAPAVRADPAALT